MEPSPQEVAQIAKAAGRRTAYFSNALSRFGFEPLSRRPTRRLSFPCSCEALPLAARTLCRPRHLAIEHNRVVTGHRVPEAAEVAAASLPALDICAEVTLSPCLLSGGYARLVSPPRAERRANVAGAIYGQVLVTSFVAALSEVANVDAGEIFTSLLVTMLVFWLAHVYADAVAQRLEREDPLTWREVWTIAKYEWPMLQAAAPALLALSLGWAGVLPTLTAVRLAIGLGVVALLAWGFVIARASRLSALATLGSVALNGVFGLGIVTLKLLVH